MARIINRQRDFFAVNQTQSERAIVFIDSSVEDVESLLAGVEAGVEAIALSPLRDGVKQIAEILANLTNISVIHIVSHGSPGSLQLGNTKLNLDNLDTYTAELQQWTDNSSPVSLLLYGCNVAAGEIGKAFVQKLSNLTGTRVAASANKTGSAALGGDWNLEVRTGEINTQLAFKPEVIAAYKAIFAEPKLEWIQDIGIPDTDDITKPMTVDSAGNVYITGGTGSSVYPYSDNWVTKYDSTGTQQWFKQLAKATSLDGLQGIVNELEGIAVDSSSNVYITGSTNGDFAGTNAGSDGSEDFWVIKYDSAGTQQWVKQLGTANSDSAQAIAVDIAGNVYITGSTGGNLAGTNAGSSDAWIAKYDSNGNQQWVKQFGTANIDFAQAIAVDIAGNVYIAGSTKDPSGTTAGLDKDWIAKYDSNGNQEYLKEFGTADSENVNKIAVDNNTGNIYISGYIYFPPQVISGVSLSRFPRLFVAKLDNSGNQLQFQQFSAGNQANFPVLSIPNSDIVVDNLGNTYVVDVRGYDLKYGIDTPLIVNSQVVKYDSSGTQQWIKPFFGYADITVASTGEIYVVNDGINNDGLYTEAIDAANDVYVAYGGSVIKGRNYSHDTRLAKLNASELLFYGTPGNDILSGGDGNDTFIAYEGDDNLTGSNGNDVLFANQGADTLDGGMGDDTLCGGKDNDTLGDAIGNNYLNGNMGNDIVNGGEGNDTLYGGKDNDILNGGDGNDRLSGDLGNDTLTGGAGSDRFVLTPTKGDDTIADFADGSDRLELTDGLTFEQLTITSGVNATLVKITSTGELLASLNGVQPNFIGVEDFIVSNETVKISDENQTLSGGNDSDIITGGNGDDRLSGEFGNDTLTGGVGSDRFVLNSGKGEDIITDFSDGIDRLELPDDLTFDGLKITQAVRGTLITLASTGEVLVSLRDVLSNLIGIEDFIASNDTVNKTIYGSSQNNEILMGGNGDDRLYGDLGNDTLTGGVGSDRFVLDPNTKVWITDFTDGIDRFELTDGLTGGIPYSFNVLNQTVLLFQGKDVNNENTFSSEAIVSLRGEQLEVIGVEDFIVSNDRFFLGTPDNDLLSGGDGNDFVVGYEGDDNLTGSNGNDVLFANQGADTLDGGTGDDTLCGGKDNDLLGDAIGNNYLNGNMGNDIVNGGAGNDTLYGGKDNDILNGGNGDDRLSGDFGNDTLTGGAGSDRFVLTPTKGPDLITDFADGSDRFELTDGLTFEQLTITSGSNATLINLTSTGELLASLSGVPSNLMGVEDFIAI